MQNPNERPIFECYECGKDIQEDIQYCSTSCFQSSML